MKFKFEELIVWQLSLEVIKGVYYLTKKFPDDEKFGMTSQIKRAATSINLNIAEGSGRGTKKDFANFVRNAIGSTIEVIACLRIAKQQDFFQINIEGLENKLQELYFKLIALDKSLKR